MYYCDDLEIKAIERVLLRKKLFRYQGKHVETECSHFEKNFASYLKAPHTLLVSSGTNALVNALFCLGIKEGDEVIVPAYTFFATLAAILELKAIPIVVNINDSLTYDIKDLQDNISPKTKAIIAVHMDGIASDMDSLLEIGKKHNLFIVEDVAQAVGGHYKNKSLGTIGDIGCFSFNADKIITCGEGGAMVFKDSQHFQKAFLYHDTCSQFGPSTKDLFEIETFSGKSMRVSEIQGAMINVQLQRLDTIISDLKERYLILKAHLENMGLTLISESDSEGSCYTTLRLFNSDVIQVNKNIVHLNSLGFISYSPLIRPAHNVWSWFDLLSKYSKQKKSYFISSIDILSKTLLIRISLDESLDEWKEKIQKITQL